MRAAGLRLLCLMTIAAALFSVAAPAHARYFCRMMQRPMVERCCGGEHASYPPPRDKSLRAADCCEVIRASARNGVVLTRESGDKPGFVSLAALAQVVAEGPALARTALSMARMPKRAPLAIGPPLFIAHRSLLI